MSSQQFNRLNPPQQYDNRVNSPRQPLPAPFYEPSNERWPSGSGLPPFGHPSPSTYPPAFPYQSARETHEYRHANSYSPNNNYCPPGYYQNNGIHDNRHLPNPYPSPTFSSPPLNGSEDQQLQAGPSRERFSPMDRQVNLYNEPPRRSPAPRHEPYRRPESSNSQREEPGREMRISEKVREGPVRPFASKVAYMLKTPEKYGEAVRWDPLGTTFILTLSNPLLYEMLTDMFSHKSLAAFTHQLNTYGFQRLTAAQLAHRFGFDSDPRLLKQFSAWSHPYFTRSDPSTLNRLLPKPSRARANQQKEKAMRILMGQGVNDYEQHYTRDEQR